MYFWIAHLHLRSLQPPSDLAAYEIDLLTRYGDQYLHVTDKILLTTLLGTMKPGYYLSLPRVRLHLANPDGRNL